MNYEGEYTNEVKESLMREKVVDYLFTSKNVPWLVVGVLGIGCFAYSTIHDSIKHNYCVSVDVRGVKAALSPSTMQTSITQQT